MVHCGAEAAVVRTVEQKVCDCFGSSVAGTLVGRDTFDSSEEGVERCRSQAEAMPQGQVEAWDSSNRGCG